MKKAILVCLLIFTGSVTFSQDKDVKAQVYYTNAEEYFNQGSYIGAEKCFDELEKAEKTLGTTNSKILYLKIKSLSKLLQPYYFYDLDLALSSFFKTTNAQTYPTDKYAEVVKLDNSYKFSEFKKKKENLKFFTSEYKKTDSALYAKTSFYYARGLQDEYNIDKNDLYKDTKLESNENYTYAFNLRMELGNRNYIDALNAVGFGYRFGRGVKRNEIEAINWYSKSTNLGNAKAMLELASIYRYGTNKDVPKAKDWCMKAVQKGSLKAMKDLGDLYKDESNYKVAFDWYTKASDSGYTDALLALGELHASGNGVKKDGVKALEIYNIVISTSKDQREKYMAMTNIAALYEFGSKGISRSHEQATQWNLKAENYLKELGQ